MFHREMEDKPIREAELDYQISDLLEAGVHFGHQKRRWNPRMEPYIYKEKNGIHIIDVRVTLEKLKEANEMLTSIAEEGKKIIFVGTKKQAKKSVKEDAERCEMFYVSERWIGGTLTNFKTIKNSIETLDEIEEMEQDGIRWEKISKKERLRLTRRKEKLLRNLSGIRQMKKAPDCMIVFDIMKENIAVKEARKLNIPLIGLVDTNTDPREVDIPIPANDDAIRSIKLFTKSFSDAIIKGRNNYLKGKGFIDKKKDSPHGKKSAETEKAGKEPVEKDIDSSGSEEGSVKETEKE